MKESLRARLEEAATKRAGSINSEILDRLDRSFDRQDLLSEILTTAYGSKEVAGLVMLLGEALHRSGEFCRMIGRLSEANAEGSGAWMTDPYAFDQAAQAALSVLEAVRPSGDTRTPAGAQRLKRRDGSSDLTFDRLGVETAVRVMADVRANPPKTDIAQQIRDLLRSLADRLPDLSSIATDALIQ